MEITDSSAVTAFGALAQETRLAIYRLLVETGPNGLPAGTIADAVGVPAPTISFHLAQLRGAGLIIQRRESRSLIYSADVAKMNALISFLSDNCCGGNPGLCAPKSKERPNERSRRKAV